MAEQLQRSGYNTREDVRDQRFDAYFNPDTAVNPNADPVTPTDFSLQQLFQEQQPPPVQQDPWEIRRALFYHKGDPYNENSPAYYKNDPKFANQSEAIKSFFNGGDEWKTKNQYGEHFYNPFTQAASPSYQEMFDRGYTVIEPTHKVGLNQKDRSKIIYDPYTEDYFYPSQQMDPSAWEFLQKKRSFGPYQVAQVIAGAGVGAGLGAAAGSIFGGAGGAGGAATGTAASSVVPAWAPATAGTVFNAAPIGAAEAAMLSSAGYTAGEIAALGAGAAGATGTAAGSLKSIFTPDRMNALKTATRVAGTLNSAKNKDVMGMISGLAGLGGVSGYVPPEIAKAIQSGTTLSKAISGKNPLSAITALPGLYQGMSKYADIASFLKNNTSGGGNMAWDDGSFTPEEWNYDAYQSPFQDSGNSSFGAGWSGMSDGSFTPDQWNYDDFKNPYSGSGFGQFGDASYDNQVFQQQPQQQQSGNVLQDIFKKGGYLDQYSPGINMIGGLAGMYLKNKQANQMQGLSSQMMQGFDPFGAQRPQYQQQLSQTYTNPALYLNSPEHQAIQKRMRDELEKKDAAGGRRSQYGSRAVQLQEAALANLFKQRGQLGEFAGAGIAPNAAVGQAAMQGLGNAQGYQSAMLGDIGRIFNDRQNQQKRQIQIDLSQF